MDRGRSPDDGPDEIEAASDNDTIDPTIEAGASLVPVEEEAAGAPDGATAEPDGAAAATDADRDGRPAAWLADIRARAPWLLEQGGALHWRASGGRAAGRPPPRAGWPAGFGGARLGHRAARRGVAGAIGGRRGHQTTRGAPARNVAGAGRLVARSERRGWSARAACEP